MSSSKSKRKYANRDPQTNLAYKGVVQANAQFMDTQCIIRKDTYFQWGLLY